MLEDVLLKHCQVRRNGKIVFAVITDVWTVETETTETETGELGTYEKPYVIVKYTDNTKEEKALEDVSILD